LLEFIDGNPNLGGALSMVILVISLCEFCTAVSTQQVPRTGPLDFSAAIPIHEPRLVRSLAGSSEPKRQECVKLRSVL
jgi:hypothetical protein